MGKLNCLERIHKSYENILKDVFGRWGRFVALNPCCTFFFSFLFLTLLISGFVFMQNYPDAMINWVPQNGWVIESRHNTQEAY